MAALELIALFFFVFYFSFDPDFCLGVKIFVRACAGWVAMSSRFLILALLCTIVLCSTRTLVQHQLDEALLTRRGAGNALVRLPTAADLEKGRKIFLDISGATEK